MNTSPQRNVLIAGAGPTGLTLACELARRGVPFRLIDSLPGPAVGSRAKGVQPRTLEVLDDLGVVDQAVAGGRFHLAMLLSDGKGGERVQDLHEGREPRPDAPYDSTLMIPHWRTESILRQRLAVFGGSVEYGTQLTGLVQEPDGVSVTLQGPHGSETSCVGWLVGCDGGRSRTRALLGLEFTGETNEAQRLLIGDVQASGLGREYWYCWGGAGGFLALAPLPGSEVYQLQASLGPEDPAEPSLELMQRIVEQRAVRSDIRLSAPSWMSMWRANVRMVQRYRVGRVLLAGDAAHVHSPAGAQGMNTGIQDAYNLGWKLAVACGCAQSTLLDSYEEERLPIAAWVLGLSGKLQREGFAQRAFPVRRDEETLQLGLNYRGCRLAQELRARPGAVRAGDRAPDAPGLSTVEGECRLFDLLRGTHFTLLAFGQGWDGVIEAAQARFGAGVRGSVIGDSVVGVRRLVDTQGHAGRAYDIQQDTLLLIRPDGYLGMAIDVSMGAPAAEPVMRYLSDLIAVE